MRLSWCSIQSRPAIFMRDARSSVSSRYSIGQTGIADPAAFEEQVGVPGATANFRTISQVRYTPEDPAWTSGAS